MIIDFFAKHICRRRSTFIEEIRAPPSPSLAHCLWLLMHFSWVLISTRLSDLSLSVLSTVPVRSSQPVLCHSHPYFEPIVQSHNYL